MSAEREIRVCRGKEVLEIAVRSLLKPWKRYLHGVHPQPKEDNYYSRFLLLDPLEALKQLGPILVRLRDLHGKSKGRPDLYFLDEGGWREFTEELWIVEALNFCFSLLAEGKDIPEFTLSLYDGVPSDVAWEIDKWRKQNNKD